MLDNVSASTQIAKYLTAIAIAFFLLFVIVPQFYILTKLTVFTFNDDMKDAILTSFSVAGFTTAIDLLFGIPLAWLLARRKFAFKGALDAIIDLPLVIPTSALGLSVALF